MDIGELDQLLKDTPGGIAKMAFDDMLTILSATDTFFSLIKSVTDKSVVMMPTSLLRMVYSADIIYVTQQLASQKSKKDDVINFNFRTLQQDGSFKWVMITGNKTDETYLSGAKSVPVYSCISMDITSFMLKYKKLEQLNDYNRAITELSRDLFFEYEIATDTLSFSEIFREIFGKESIITGFRKRLENSKMVHPEELPAVISIFSSLMKGRKQVRFEVRLIPKGGKPIWYLCYASMIFDENRNPYKVVGKFSVTNPIEVEPHEKSIYTPHYDSLTSVYNKESSEHMIEEAAKSHGEDELGAMFLVEVKNYKGMNEMRKSIGGKNVLVEVGDMLKDSIRTTDIIGRIGMGEFVLYMKNVPSDREVYRQAEHLCKRIEEIFALSYTKNNVFLSIGIVIHRGVQNYQALHTSANVALVMAKKVSNSSFEVFSGNIN